MDSNSVSTSTGLEWQNLNLYPNPIEIPQQIGFSMSSSSSSSQFLSSSSSNYPQSTKNMYDDDIFRNISEPLIGLGLGTHKQYGDTFLSNTTSIPVSSTPTKRSRASYQNMQNPCCQVQGCNLDLKSAKDYHRRHRICETHSKSPKVIVAGKERRFCQQCSRFHDLSEFDDKKRSCRRRLSDHNARRRRVQPESIQLTSTGTPSSLYDERHQNVLLSGLPISLSNPTWENGSSASVSRQVLIGPSKARGLNETLNFSSDDIFESSIHAPNPRLLQQCLHVPNTNQSMAPDLLNAHSLLSPNTWSMNESESSTMDGLVHGNYNTVMRHSGSESHHLSLFSIPVQQEPPVSLHNAGSSNHQEYQLFNDSAAFYSSQRYL